MLSEACGSVPGVAVSTECKPMTAHGGDIASFNKLMGVAFLCDLSRIGFLSVGQYEDHNGVWHSGVDGNTDKVPTFNKLAIQAASPTVPQP